jgi:hypothetical protein
MFRRSPRSAALAGSTSSGAREAARMRPANLLQLFLLPRSQMAFEPTYSRFQNQRYHQPSPVERWTFGDAAASPNFSQTRLTSHLQNCCRVKESETVFAQGRHLYSPTARAGPLLQTRDPAENMAPVPAQQRTRRAAMDSEAAGHGRRSLMCCEQSGTDSREIPHRRTGRSTRRCRRQWRDAHFRDRRHLPRDRHFLGIRPH